MLSEFIYTSTYSNSFLSNPEPINPLPYIHRAPLIIDLILIFGINTTSINDPLFKRLDKWIDNFTRMFSNVNRKLDYFPILKYHPGNNMKKVSYLINLPVCDTYKNWNKYHFFFIGCK